MPEDAVHVSLAGNGDMDAVPVIEGYVPVFHERALKHKSKTIRFDLTHLYFLNSSCLKALSSLVDADSKLGPDDQYKIIFYLGLPWQSRSLKVLQSLGRGFVILEDSSAVAQGT